MTRDPLDDLGLDAQPPGLGQLFSDLASPALDSELAGQRAALSMFRAARAEQAAPTAPLDAASAAQTPVPGPARGQRSRRSARPESGVRKARVGGRLVAAAMFLALAGGFAAAGYAAVLPAPLQRVAYQILGFAGVPDSRQPHLPHPPPVSSHAVDHHSPDGSPSPSVPTSSSPALKPSHHKSPTPKPKTPSRSHSPHPAPGPTGPVQIAIAVDQQAITAGQSVQITASLTRHGSAAGIKVSLLELAAGQAAQPGAPGGRGWRVVAKVASDARGQATFTAPDLTTNALFRVVGPGGAVSNRIGVAVAPPIQVSLESGPRPKVDLLVAASPLAQRGDVVELEAEVRGLWRVVRVRRLHKDGQTIFNVPLRKISVIYRVVIPATRVHAASVSSPVTAPARIKHAKKVP